MKRFTLAVCAGLVALAMAPPSLAANLPPPRTPYKAPLYSPVPVFSWTGFYVGIVGGYAWGDSDWSSGTATGSTNPDGGLIGGTLGYNLQTGNWVWGIEGDIEYSWIKGTDTGGTGLCSGTGCETKNTWFGTREDDGEHGPQRKRHGSRLDRRCRRRIRLPDSVDVQA